MNSRELVERNDLHFPGSPLYRSGVRSRRRGLSGWGNRELEQSLRELREAVVESHHALAQGLDLRCQLPQAEAPGDGGHPELGLLVSLAGLIGLSCQLGEGTNCRPLNGDLLKTAQY